MIGVGPLRIPCWRWGPLRCFRPRSIKMLDYHGHLVTLAKCRACERQGVDSIRNLTSKSVCLLAIVTCFDE